MNYDQFGPPAPTRRIAIVGAGPSACFLALQLRRRLPDLELVLVEALPTPYGLVRHGIAPDHQGAKAVQQQFDRLFRQPDVHFVGNVRVGRDLQLGELTALFDMVVLATGLPADRALDVPHDGVDVVGAGALLRCLNSDPDSLLRTPGPLPDLGADVAVIGTGNVAIDVIRLLAKTEDELQASDVDDDALRALRPRPMRTVHVLGRCAPGDAKWDSSMLRELAAVRGVHLTVDGVPFGGDDDAGATEVRVRFGQSLTDLACEGERVRVRSVPRGGAGAGVDVLVDTVISAVGFGAGVDGDLAVDEPASGRVVEVGGRVTGRLGNLAENRKLAVAAAAEIAQRLDGLEVAPRGGYAGLRAVLPTETVSFDDWRRIETAEVDRARPGRCRTKFTTREELLTAARSDGASTFNHPPRSSP